MDNHPIPQDVTHFQFKLIGEMTIKQFGYVAAGAILAWITFSLPVIFLIKLLFASLFAFLGVFFAFIPVEGRPADLMVSYFLKALINPDQYIFQKAEGRFLSKTSANTTQQKKVDVTESQKISQISSLSFTSPQPNVNVPSLQQRISQSPPTPTSPPPQNPQYAPIPQQIITPVKQTPREEKETPQIPQAAPPPESSKVNQLQQELTSTLAQKQELEKQLLSLKTQMEQEKKEFTAQPPPQEQLGVGVKRIPKPPSLPKNLPLTSDFPNLIVGEVKDARGNVLPNILIEVKDKEGNPVRAFKTNALGQFASATPLLNGTYTVLFEDPGEKHKFDAFEITASGNIMQPLVIVSVDGREELRRELFGKPQQ